MSLAKNLLDRFSKIESQRSNYNSTWQVLGDYVMPNRVDFDIERSPGDVRNKKLYDTTAIHANQLLSATLHGGVTNASSDWFDLAFEDISIMTDASKRFLSQAKKELVKVLNSTTGSFQGQAHEFYLSLVCFGTAVMFIEEDDTGKINFATLHLSEIFIGENAYGQVDTVFRKFKLTPRQAVQMWGADNLHPRLLEDVERNPDEKYDFIHAALPKIDLKDEPEKNKKFPISSVYIDVKNQHVVSKGGFMEMPYVVARFEKLAGEVYGRSPAWHALSDIRMINAMSKSIIRSAQLQTSPPLLVADDGVMMPLEARPNGMIIGGINGLDGTPRVAPLNVGGSLGVGVELLQQRQASIRNAFFIDPLMFREGTPATATEQLQRQEEKLRLLSPHIVRIQSEFLNPLMKRVFGLLVRSNKVGEVPQELSKSSLKIEYKSPLIRLQKAGEIQALGRFLQSVGPLIQMKPDSLDIVNIDEVMAKMAEATGLDISVLRSSNDIANIRQAREQQMQQQQALNQAEQMSNIAKQGGPALNDLLGGGNE
tara:strand:- start:11978 stop:13594 length:1617 start_codon:yes stop_codon:yes gene_type:complete